VGATPELAQTPGERANGLGAELIVLLVVASSPTHMLLPAAVLQVPRVRREGDDIGDPHAVILAGHIAVLLGHALEALQIGTSATTPPAVRVELAALGAGQTLLFLLLELLGIVGVAPEVLAVVELDALEEIDDCAWWRYFKLP